MRLFCLLYYCGFVCLGGGESERGLIGEGGKVLLCWVGKEREGGRERESLKHNGSYCHSMN